MACVKPSVRLFRMFRLCVVSVALFVARSDAFSALRSTPVAQAAAQSSWKPGHVFPQASLSGGRLPDLRAEREKPRKQEAPEHSKEADDDARPVDKAIDDVTQHSRQVARKALKADEEVPEEFDRDKQRLQRSFLPGFEMSLHTLALMNGAVVIALLWFIVYFNFLYENDRCEFFGNSSQAPKPRDPKGAKKEFNQTIAAWQSTMLFGYLDKERFARSANPPDLMIVFHHPHNKRADDGAPVFKSTTDDMFKNVAPSERARFPQVQAIVDRDTQATARSQESDRPPTLQDGVTMREVRVALLQDLYAIVPKFGICTDIYHSVDHERLFVCLSMDDDAWIQHYLRHQHLELHVAADVVNHSKLGVGSCSDPDAQSSPFVRFDPWLVARMHERGVIEKDDPRLFYKTHHGKNPKGELVSSQDRFKIIHQQVARVLNLDTIEEAGVIEDWFPTHRLLSLQKLGVTWASATKLTDLSFVQPIGFLRNYFGPRIAFSFAWQGLMCKAYLVLVPIAIIWELSTAVGRSYFGVDEKGFTAFSLIIVTWAKVSANLWDREEEYFTKLWNLERDGVQGKLIRPEFKGKMSVSDVDSNVPELQVSGWQTSYKSFVAGLATFGFVLMVALCVFAWIQIFEGRMNMVASICLAIQIKVFELIFNVFANALNEWQNHKYYDQHYDSLLLKQFCFRFVNSYSTFFYLAIKQRFTAAGCPAGGCLAVMQHQLTVTLVVLSVLRVVTVTMTSFRVQFSLWLENRQFRKKNDGAEPPKRTFLEEQSKYSENNVQQQIESMLELVIALGFVILFGGVAPVIIPFCFAVFMVQLRAQAFLLVTSTKRSIPRRAQGIGYWRSVITILMHFGVLFNGFLLAVYGDNLKGQQLITKITVVMFFCLMSSIIGLVVDLVCSGTSATGNLMTERRGVVMNKIYDEAALAADDLEDADRKARSRATTELSVTDNGDDDVWVANGDWEKIQGCEDPNGEF